MSVNQNITNYIFDSRMEGIFSFDFTLRVTFWNTKLEKLFNVKKQDAIGHSIYDMIPGMNLSQDQLEFKLRDGKSVQLPNQTFVTSEGIEIHYQGTFSPLFDENGERIGGFAIIEDTTEQKNHVALRDVELKFLSVIESSSDAIILADSKSTIISWNNGAKQIFGYEKHEILGKKLEVLMPERFRAAHNAGVERYSQTKNPHVIGKTVELCGIRKDGSEFPLELSLGSWETDEDIYFSGIIRDITERKRTEEKIHQMAYFDRLTGLPNRSLFQDRLSIALEQAQREGHELAVMFIDLDRFKFVNDTLGHTMGDYLLQEVAGRLQSCLLKGDTVSRQGGDEFCVFLPRITQELIAETAQKMIGVVGNSYQLAGHEVYITPSIGISLSPYDGSDVETLMKNADVAMYRAKELGRNNYQFYTTDMNETVNQRLELEKELRRAIEQEEFELHYQPQVQIETGELIGFEALIRWNHGKKGYVQPDHFIPLAEETGLIIPITEWVLRTACRQNKLWQEKGFPCVPVAVNLSAFHLQVPNFIPTVSKILKESQLDPCYLELEITERGAMENAVENIEKLKALKAMGIRISIDDFGTGYSSLSYLKRFPIDTLKIDRSFISDLESTETAMIVKTIIALAQSLKLKVIAEGVETSGQLDFLKHHLCDEAQGYLFSKPMAVEDIEESLSTYLQN